MLGAEFDLTFEVRPRNVTGLIFHCRGHQDHRLSVFLKKGTVSLWLEFVVGIMDVFYDLASIICFNICSVSWAAELVTNNYSRIFMQLLQLKELISQCLSIIQPHCDLPAMSDCFLNSRLPFILFWPRKMNSTPIQNTDAQTCLFSSNAYIYYNRGVGSHLGEGEKICLYVFIAIAIWLAGNR